MRCLWIGEKAVNGFLKAAEGIGLPLTKMGKVGEEWVEEEQKENWEQYLPCLPQGIKCDNFWVICRQIDFTAVSIQGLGSQLFISRTLFHSAGGSTWWEGAHSPAQDSEARQVWSELSLGGYFKVLTTVTQLWLHS